MDKKDIINRLKAKEDTINKFISIVMLVGLVIGGIGAIIGRISLESFILGIAVPVAWEAYLANKRSKKKE